MMKAIQFKQYGGPEVLTLVDKEKPIPKAHEVLIDIKAIGVNYADTARREGKYVVPTALPFIPGSEVAGIVMETGKNVKNIQKGMRVAALIESGGYAEYALAPEAALIPIPDDVDFNKAAALPLQGLTAYHILKTMGRLEAGECVLVHAAAGGVGSIAVQLAKRFGAGKVIATASTAEKLAFAEKLGADHLINYTEDGWEEHVRELTDGKGVDVALEMAGGDVFQKTAACLAPFGRLIIYGVASGEEAPFYPSSLMRSNQSVIGFFLPQMMKKQKEFQSSLQELVAYMKNGTLELTVGGVHPLSEAAQVHKLLQGRKTKGKLILVP